MRYLLLALLLLTPAAAHSQSCTPNNNSSFSINGNILSSNSPLAVGTYTAGIFVNMGGVTNSGTCFPVTVTGQTSGGGTPAITVNGSSTGITVSAGSLLTVAVSNGPGNATDWMSVCNTGTPSSANCNSSGYSWDYIQNCSRTPPTTGVASGTCTLSAPLPTSTTTYAVQFLANDSYTSLASAPFSVTGTGSNGGGGSSQPYGSIPCPRGCTWTNQFNADFTTMNASIFDRTPNITSALLYVPVDGSSDSYSGGGTFACDQGALDTSHMPGYLALHAVGTLVWEVPGNLSCGVFPKNNTTQGNIIGCQGSCVPIPGPAIFEYKAQLAANQIDEVSITGATNKDVYTCGDLFYFYEARGNGSWNGGGPHTWSYTGCEPINSGTTQSLSNYPHVLDLLIDPQTGYTWYEDGSAVYSTNVGNCPSGTCAGKWPIGREFISAISNCFGGCTQTAGGTWAIYWIREFRGY